MRWITELVVKEALAIAASEHGHVLNQALFARQLHLSIPTVSRLIRGMASMGWIRLLPALCPEGADRCFRRPRIQLTDASLLTRILGPQHEGQAAAVSLTESIIKAERRINPKSRFLHYGAYELRSLDLIVERDGLRTGYLFLEDLVPHTRMELPLRRAVRQGVVTRGFVLHRGGSCFFSARWILAVPAQVFLARYEEFTEPREGLDVWLLLARWVNHATVGDVTVQSIFPRPPFRIDKMDPGVMRLTRRL